MVTRGVRNLFTPFNILHHYDAVCRRAAADPLLRPRPPGLAIPHTHTHTHTHFTKGALSQCNHNQQHYSLFP